MAKSFEVIERVGISKTSTSAAIQSAVLEAHDAKNPVSWFEVIEERGRVDSDGKLEYQVKVKIGRKLK